MDMPGREPIACIRESVEYIRRESIEYIRMELGGCAGEGAHLIVKGDISGREPVRCARGGVC